MKETSVALNHMQGICQNQGNAVYASLKSKLTLLPG